MVRGSVTNRDAESGPRVRRGYFENRFGQLHVHNAIPPGGGFDEGTPLLCLHPAPMTGRVFARFMTVMGRDRSVYAPDLPGYGESDPPAPRPTIADYAAAVGDFIETMRFRQIDVLGFRDGSFVAAELALSRPNQVRRVVFISVPMYTDADRDAFRRAPWPVPVAQDGSHLMVEWRRTVESSAPGTPLDVLARRFAEKLYNGPHAWWGLHAALEYPLRERVTQISQPTAVLRPRDELWESSGKVRELLPRGRLVDLPEHGADVLDTAPAAVVNALAEFLRG